MWLDVRRTSTPKMHCKATDQRHVFGIKRKGAGHTPNVSNLATAPQKHELTTCGAGQPFAETWVRQERHLSAACRSENLKVQSLLVVPGLVFGPQPDIRRNDVDGAVARCQPLVLRVGEHDKATAVRPLVAVRLGTGAPQWQHAVCRPRDDGVIDGRFDRRETALPACRLQPGAPAQRPC